MYQVSHFYRKMHDSMYLVPKSALLMVLATNMTTRIMLEHLSGGASMKRRGKKEEGKEEGRERKGEDKKREKKKEGEKKGGGEKKGDE